MAHWPAWYRVGVNAVDWLYLIFDGLVLYFRQ
jgi:hypothetical protein